MMGLSLYIFTERVIGQVLQWLLYRINTLGIHLHHGGNDYMILE
jgi:hypothetical protein